MRFKFLLLILVWGGLTGLLLGSYFCYNNNIEIKISGALGWNFWYWRELLQGCCLIVIVINILYLVISVVAFTIYFGRHHVHHWLMGLWPLLLVLLRVVITTLMTMVVDWSKSYWCCCYYSFYIIIIIRYIIIIIIRCSRLKWISSAASFEVVVGKNVMMICYLHS